MLPSYHARSTARLAVDARVGPAGSVGRRRATSRRSSCGRWSPRPLAWQSCGAARRAAAGRRPCAPYGHGQKDAAKGLCQETRGEASEGTSEGQLDLELVSAVRLPLVPDCSAQVSAVRLRYRDGGDLARPQGARRTCRRRRECVAATGGAEEMGTIESGPAARLGFSCGKEEGKRRDKKEEKEEEKDGTKEDEVEE